MTGLRTSVLALRFLCELGLLAGAAYAGAQLGEGAVAWVFAVGAPVLVAIVWATFVSPKARRPVSTPIRLMIEIDLYVATGIALWFADAVVVGILLAVAGIGTSVGNALTEGAGDGVFGQR
jgi:uncharacterized protein DUF2568